MKIIPRADALTGTVHADTKDLFPEITISHRTQSHSDGIRITVIAHTQRPHDKYTDVLFMEYAERHSACTLNYERSLTRSLSLKQNKIRNGYKGYSAADRSPAK